MEFQRHRLNRRVIKDLKKRSSAGILFYLLVPYFLFFTEGYIHSRLLSSILFLGLLTAVCLFRLVHLYISKKTRKKFETLNNKIFITSVVITALIWGGGAAFFLIQDDNSSVRLLMAICTAGFCSGGVVSFMPAMGLAVAYNLIMFLPAATALLITGDITLGILFIAYSIYMLLMTFRGSSEYWTALENEFLLKQKSRELKKISRIDVLTGLYNRRHFDELFKLAWGLCSRRGTALTLMICDIDHFKKVNDTFGHLAGDEYLKLISRILLKTFQRETDIVARYGGEEFVIMLSDKDDESTWKLAEHFRNAAARAVLDYKGEKIKATVSLGMTSLIPSPEQKRETMIALADTALYKAKHAGRNQVKVHKQKQEG